MKKKERGYLSSRESGRLSREGRKLTAQMEKTRKRKSYSPDEYAAQMNDKSNIVEFDGLKAYFYTDIGVVKAVDGVDFSVPRGKTVGIVGESGCGKSITSLSLMQLLQRPQGQITGGAIRFNGAYGCIDIAKTPEDEMRKIRGNQISMIFQEPMTSLNPVFRVGAQVDEVIGLHLKSLVEYGIMPTEALSGGKKTAARLIRERTEEMLATVGIADPKAVYAMFPHELSGGMRQRVMIAMALACSPRLIIADEPTTALDVTIQAQILELLRSLRDRINAGIMLITHDLGVVAETADYVVVMYAGRIVEKGTVEEVFERPCHPYTIGLMKSKPVVNRRTDRLYSIPGKVPNPVSMPDYCYFYDRCEKRMDKCRQMYPPQVEISPTHSANCLLYGEESK